MFGAIKKGCTQFDTEFCSSDFNWRDSIVPEPIETESIFNCTVGFLSASLFGSLLMWLISIGFFFPSGRNSTFKMIYILLGVVVIFCLAVALFLFAGRLSTALEDDGWLCNVGGVSGPNTGPCNKFIGSAQYVTNGDNVIIKWGAIGYWIAVVAALSLLLAIGLIIPPFPSEQEIQYHFDSRVQLD